MVQASEPFENQTPFENRTKSPLYINTAHVIEQITLWVQ